MPDSHPIEPLSRTSDAPCEWSAVEATMSVACRYSPRHGFVPNKLLRTGGEQWVPLRSLTAKGAKS